MSWLLELLKAILAWLSGRGDPEAEADYLFISPTEYLTDGVSPLKWRR